jgi:hypothetical protein
MTATLLEFSELALASYANLDPSKPTDGQITALNDADFTVTKAEAFAIRYPAVITQFNDTAAEGGAGTSLSATIFKDAEGNLTLAFRGTLEKLGTPNDLSTDADILGSGAAYDQIVAMANWWRSVSATPGEMVVQHRLAT